MGNRPWTKRRVLRAYSEWKALEDHACAVVAEIAQLSRWESSDFYRLCLPGWIGTNWPGSEFEYDTYDGDHRERMPMEYLWSEEALEQVRAESAAWAASAAARAQEAEERRTYERLKAKFEETDHAT
jgi:hypothetical protein